MKKKIAVYLLCFGLLVPETIPYAASIQADATSQKEDQISDEVISNEKSLSLTEDNELSSEETTNENDITLQKDEPSENKTSQEDDKAENIKKEQQKEYTTSTQENSSETDELNAEKNPTEDTTLNSTESAENKQTKESVNEDFYIVNGVLRKYYGKNANVVIPSDVKVIGSSVFYNCQTVQSVEIPDSVTNIETSAFGNCSNLKTVKFSNNLQEIGEFAFFGTNLEKVVLPNSVKIIGSSAFHSCKSLVSVVMPAELENIEKSTFYGCDSLNDVSMNAKLKSIGTSAFSHCSSLKTINLPASLLEIKQRAFEASGLESVVLPDKITTIETYTFVMSQNLKEITIPASVTNIGQYAFSRCDSLKNIKMLGNAPATNYPGISYNAVIHIPMGATGYDKDPWTKYKQEVAHLDSVKNLKAYSHGKKKTRLTWDKVNGAEGYLIYAQKNGNYGYCGMTTTGTSFIDTKALDTDYNFYWVFPYIIDNSTQKKIPGSCPKYVYAKGVIPAVQNLKASSVKNGVKLSWTKQTDAEGYLVYGQNGENFKYHFVGMTTKGTTFTDKKASKKDYNFYWVFPYHKNAAGKMIVGGTAPYTYGRAK